MEQFATSGFSAVFATILSVAGLVACSSAGPLNGSLDAGLFNVDSATPDAGQDILIQVSCAQSLSDAGMYTDLCTCTASSVDFGSGGSTSTTYSGETCPRDDQEICCADSTYPSSGTCNCEYSGKAFVWGCLAASVAGDCQCGYGVSGATPGSKCDTTLAAFSNCYLTIGLVPNDTLCGCGPDAAAGDVTVTACTTEAAAGLTPYLSSCPAGQVEMDVCGTVTPATGSGTGSGGDGGVTRVGCDPESCADGSGCYCSFPINSPGSTCMCPDPGG